MSRRHLRFLTLNLWREDRRWEPRLALITRKLDGSQPDIVALQEVSDIPGRIPNQAALLAGEQGWRFVTAAATEPGESYDGLAIMSRFPILAHEVRHLPGPGGAGTRLVLSARVDTDFGEVWVHNTQLIEADEDGHQREEQVVALDDVVATHKSERPQVILGDFNAMPTYDEIRWMSGKTTLGGRRVCYQDAWDTLHPDLPGWTWARANPGTDLKYWLRPDRRVDYAFVTPVQIDRRGTVHAVRLIFDDPEMRSSGERVFASDHYGLVVEIQYQPGGIL